MTFNAFVGLISIHWSIVRLVSVIAIIKCVRCCSRLRWHDWPFIVQAENDSIRAIESWWTLNFCIILHPPFAGSVRPSIQVLWKFFFSFIHKLRSIHFLCWWREQQDCKTASSTHVDRRKKSYKKWNKIEKEPRFDINEKKSLQMLFWKVGWCLHT